MSATIRIGHASTDAASSSANEVLISNYYDMDPDVVLRPISADLAEKSAAACEAGCNNNKIEYSQSYRNTLYDRAVDANFDLSKISTTCYADCSSFMTVCAIAGGSSIEYSPAPNCGTMRVRFTQSGDYEALTASKYLNSSAYLQRGDILVREHYIDGSRHTVMILDNGAKVPAKSSTIKLLSDLTIVKIAIDILNVYTNSVDLKTTITQVKNGVEKPLTELDLYKWTSTVEKVNGSGKKIVTDIAKISNKLSLSDLDSDTSYRLNILASEASGAESFSSPSIIFTTAGTEKPLSDSSTSFVTDEPLTRVREMYLKINDDFKPVTLYNN